MNKSFRLLYFFAIVSVFLMVSCRKEKKEKDDRLSMSGSISFDLPEYIHGGETLELRVSGITKPEKIVYKWVLPGISKDTLEGENIKVIFPKEVAKYTVTAIAKAEGYYSTSITKNVTVLDTSQNGSLKGRVFGNRVFIDPRDGKKYHTSVIGNLEWFSENLAWAQAGTPYKKADALQYLLGRLYSWNEATEKVSSSGLGKGPQGVCPKGWSVPTNEDWEDLGKALNGGNPIPFSNKWEKMGQKVTVLAYLNGEKLWPYSPDNTPANMFTWNALPCGYSQYGYTYFKGLSSYGMWWSSTEINKNQAYYRYIYYNDSAFPSNYTAKDDFGASVRCVRKITEGN